MTILVACEFSGTVRDAFAACGHDAWSCDLLPSETEGSHILGDAIEAMQSRRWDMIIAHPPCTFLTVSANKWMKPEFASRFPNRARQREDAISFFMALFDASCERVAVENPIGVMSTRFRKPDQVIQPFQFGHPERKATCLWLRGLPILRATNIVNLPKEAAKAQRLHYLPPSKDRWKIRSKTFPGIAQAMAEQWGRNDD